MSASNRQFDHSGLEIISETDCRLLLGSVPIGRLVFTLGALPAVRVLNFLVDNDAILFRTSSGDKLRAAQRGDVVAFEIDDIDEDRHLGWTVTAIGHLSVVDPEAAARSGEALPLRPWAPYRDDHLIQLKIESLDGRRLLAWARDHTPTHPERATSTDKTPTTSTPARRRADLRAEHVVTFRSAKGPLRSGLMPDVHGIGASQTGSAAAVAA